MTANEQKLTYSCIILQHFIVFNNGDVITVVYNVYRGNTPNGVIYARTMIFYFMTSY